jgi:hypothetical protein
MTRTDGRLPLVGLGREQHVLFGAVDRQESLLMLGPAGSGKTRLLESALESGSEAGAMLYIPQFNSPHDLVVKIARELFRSRHRGFCRMASAGSDWESWLKCQTSVHLKGLLWESLETEPRALFLDGLSGAGHQTHRFLQRLYFTPGAALVAAARDHLRLGELRRLFWDPGKTLHVQPLSEAEALELFEAAAGHFGLRGLSLDDFREKVLDWAGGNPGQIIEMCRLARDPRYLSGRYIKFALVRIDAMVKCLS